MAWQKVAQALGRGLALVLVYALSVGALGAAGVHPGWSPLVAGLVALGFGRLLDARRLRAAKPLRRQAEPLLASEAPSEQEAPPEAPAPMAMGSRLERLASRFEASVGEAHDSEAVALALAEALGRGWANAEGPAEVAVWVPERDAYTLMAFTGPDPGLPAIAKAWAEAPDTGWAQDLGFAEALPLVVANRQVALVGLGPRAGACRARAEGARWFDRLSPAAAWAFAACRERIAADASTRRLNNALTLYRAASARAITDGLTGLHTHAYFQAELAKRFADARRHAGPLSLILVDVDHFKRLNDNHGHPMGDAVLKAVAKAVAAEARAGDTVARYGGEELVLVLPGAELTGAAGLAERIRASVAAVGGPEGANKEWPEVTVSVGVATLCAQDTGPESLVSRADAQLYVAKRAGRNRVCLAAS